MCQQREDIEVSESIRPTSGPVIEEASPVPLESFDALRPTSKPPKDWYGGNAGTFEKERAPNQNYWHSQEFWEDCLRSIPHFPA